MNPSEAGMAALHMMSNLLDGLLSADTGLHHDGYAHGEEANHRHPLLSGEARDHVEGVKARVDHLILAGFDRPMLSRGIDGAARKYAGVSYECGQCGGNHPTNLHAFGALAVSPSYDHSPSEVA